VNKETAKRRKYFKHSKLAKLHFARAAQSIRRTRGMPALNTASEAVDMQSNENIPRIAGADL
jgi:hypothetical protein